MEENFSNGLSIKTGERLHKLRIGSGLSLEKLRKEIYKKYGVEISKDSLINYEVSDVANPRKYKNNGMRIEYLRYFSDFYGVSSDYLLGLTDVPTTDTTIQAICNCTGLSDDFISWLEIHKDYAPQIERLSKLMIENGFIGGDNSEQE